MEENPDTPETAQQAREIKRSEPALQGVPSVFEGKQPWKLTVSFQPGDRIVENGNAADDLAEGYERIPVVDGYLSCSVSMDSASRPEQVKSSNEIWLESDGETVHMKRFPLWKKGDRSARFKLHYTDGQTIVSGDFSGEFGANGEVEGTFEGRFMLLKMSAGPGGRLSLSRIGMWTVANGQFTFSPAAQAAAPQP